MGIDGIGKKGPAVPAPPERANVSAPSRPFDLGPTNPVPPAAQVPSTALSALNQLHAGLITPNEYLELKVQQATSHLTMLSPAELDSVRGALRDRLAADPSLADLVRAVTGSAPQPPRDE
jgi:hypothetical protein